MSSISQIIKSLVEQTQEQFNKHPTEIDIMTFAFTLVPKIEQLVKGTFKGSEKMEILLGTLDALLNTCNQEIAGPIRASLKERITPAVSGLINATHTGNINFGIASTVALATEVAVVASKGCFCMGHKFMVKPQSRESTLIDSSTNTNSSVEESFIYNISAEKITSTQPSIIAIPLSISLPFPLPPSPSKEIEETKEETKEE
jgi:hypothetical protein